MRNKPKTDASGFTLLEVLVALAILGVGVALTLSLITGSLSNIRKVQQRTRNMHYAQTVMELTLLDDSIRKPTTLRGDFPDGTLWNADVADYEIPRDQPLNPRQLPSPVKLLLYSVEIRSPQSQTPDFRLETLKLVSVQDRRLGAAAAR
jgi:prepilin-type N-terminal cleavage/methylation domain-containing protein